MYCQDHSPQRQNAAIPQPKNRNISRKARKENTFKTSRSWRLGGRIILSALSASALKTVADPSFGGSVVNYPNESEKE